MEDLSRILGIERLDLDNYSSWCVRVKCLLVSKGLWKPTQETPADEEQDAKSLSVIGMTLAQQHLATFAEFGNACQLDANLRHGIHRCLCSLVHGQEPGQETAA